jgi:hypothetical protein
LKVQWGEIPTWFYLHFIAGTGTFASYMIVSAFTLVFVIVSVPETKGRTLKEIQWSFRWAPASSKYKMVLWVLSLQIARIWLFICNGSLVFCHFRWRTLVHIIGVLGYCFAAQITWWGPHILSVHKRSCIWDFIQCCFNFTPVDL